MKLADLPDRYQRRIVAAKFTPDGDVTYMRLGDGPPRAAKVEPEKEPVRHDPENAMCPCDDCRILFQAADH